ncbi:hypothetical protein CPB83DRAFT_89661 [Crepidotus variabilis]|uniref:F-box domain-containing protein n=1 Tax=Crepidotus variabilis TaxID=179855 RepID=A0A9P6E535_9AGAR|nr:hypothetical protein CPB83DRAFT_89661 [Crepidotus variabilis]
MDNLSLTSLDSMCPNARKVNGHVCAACSRQLTIAKRLGEGVPKLDQTQIESLHRELRETKSKINQTHDIIQRIPLELIQIILGQACPSSPPFQLGAVCRFWRDVVWSAPNLWTNVTFVLSDTNLSNRIGLLKQVTSLSGNAPLKIEISEGRSLTWSSENIQNNEDFHLLLDVILDCSSRWLDLNLTAPVYFIRQLHLASSSTPILNSLTLAACVMEKLEEPFSLDLQHLTQRLRNFEISETDCLRLDLFQISFNHLAVLKAPGSTAKWYDVICSAPALSSVQIIGCELGLWEAEEDEPTPPQAPFVHKSLQTFLLEGGRETWYFSFFFEWLSLPNLKHLEIRVHLAGIQSDSVERFLARSACSLDSLVLSDQSWSVTSLSSIFVHLPALTRLSLLYSGTLTSAKDYCAAVFQTGSEDRGSSRAIAPLPSLQMFELEASWPMADGFNFLTDIFHQVTHNQTSFSRLSLYLRADRPSISNARLSKEILRRIEEFSSGQREVRIGLFGELNIPNIIEYSTAV